MHGFHVLRLNVPVPGSIVHNDETKKSAIHSLYIKEHVLKKPVAELPAKRTLFVLNLPVSAEACGSHTLHRPF
ncbi:hypothetical protein PTSG_03347 [Salpingoeca rosetta]|uniref:Rrp7 RRM-like N-terminal domain-containing protein n=1 Tax=Salpingoeca rosetta (strain ATCC 50818 / BSB-021) TaxID=946362 RepID=F2U4X0_SALR5|nr:uncharacterized protein PTSG_03347 [Salpingoeca rosetta]EGD82686.1 hypothetical protein PTSG_03347 [Salpingoeca rosetta]|eukprot:XP_004995922.1 hypothetical protein PTSG_03347 [Salpingoeca rosetta]